MSENKMTLGPIQQKWVDTLRAHPERQFKKALSNGDGTKMCCLGQAVCILRNIEYGTGKVLDEGIEYYLSSESTEDLGLNDDVGLLTNYHRAYNRTFASLAEMNDGGMTWAEIADYIEANPDNVFTKSI